MVWYIRNAHTLLVGICSLAVSVIDSTDFQFESRVDIFFFLLSAHSIFITPLQWHSREVITILILHVLMRDEKEEATQHTQGSHFS